MCAATCEPTSSTTFTFCWASFVLLHEMWTGTNIFLAHCFHIEMAWLFIEILTMSFFYLSISRFYNLGRTFIVLYLCCATASNDIPISKHSYYLLIARFSWSKRLAIAIPSYNVATLILVIKCLSPKAWTQHQYVRELCQRSWSMGRARCWSLTSSWGVGAGDQSAREPEASACRSRRWWCHASSQAVVTSCGLPT